MKLKFSEFSLRTKLLVGILSFTILLFSITVVYFSLSMRSVAIRTIELIYKEKANSYAKTTLLYTNRILGMGQSLASTLGGMANSPKADRDEVIRILESKLIDNTDLASAWTVWEPNAFDGKDSLFINKPGHDFTGRLITAWNLSGGTPQLSHRLDYDIEGVGDYYLLTKERGKTTLLEPYFYSYTDGKVRSFNSKYIASIVFPIYQNNIFLGVVGFDILLSNIQDIASDFKEFEKRAVHIFTSEGRIISHANPMLIGEPVPEYQDKKQMTLILDAIRVNLPFVNNHFDEGSDDFILSVYVPMKVEKNSAPWILCLSVPYSKITKNASKDFLKSLLLGLMVLIILSAIIFYIAHYLTQPIHSTTKSLSFIAETGEISPESKIEVKTKDDIGKMANAVNSLIDSLINTSKFANEIGKGNLKVEYKTLGDKDLLGNALIEMQKNLVELQEEGEKRKLEEEKRNWTTRGVAKFGEIIRQENSSISDLAFSIISNLIDYLDAKLGGVFLLNETDKKNIHLELVASYAYNRRKYIRQKVELGEGLVGTCAVEGKTTLLSEIPSDYVNISSGFGNANPRSLLLVPMKLDTRIFGVIELASFEVFEQYQIEFVEILGESIASTLNNLRVSEHTSVLLDESKKQAEEMASQEEEMRQNLEELQATQEAAARKQAELSEQLDAINQINAMIEFDLSGIVIKANEIFCSDLGYLESEIRGKHHDQFVDPENRDEDENINFWSDLKEGKAKNGEFKRIKSDGSFIYFRGTYYPMRNEHGDVYKVILLAFNVTSSIQQANELDTKAREMEQKQLEIQSTNEKLKRNEAVLKKALMKAKDSEKAISIKNKELADKEAIMNQHLKELQKTQDKVARSEAEMAGIIEAIDHTLIKRESELDGTITSVNELYYETFKYRPKEVLGKNIRDFVPAEFLDEFEKNWKAVCRGKALTGVIQRKTKKGDVIWLLRSYTPIKDTKGKVLRVLYLANDITELKRKEDKLREISKEMEVEEAKLLKYIKKIKKQDDDLKGDKS